jgi:hypothetical protein
MAKVWNPQLNQWMDEDGNPSAGQNIGPGSSYYGSQAPVQTQQPTQYANRSQEINAQNPTGSPDLPYVQAGDTGGYLAGKGVTIGEGRSITPEEAASQKQQFLAAGYSESDYADFMARNPGDSNRALEAQQNGGDNPTGGSSVSQQWNSTGSAVGNRANDFYSLLMDRANQGLNVDRNNPQVRQQSDAYSANMQRSRREYLNDQAEAIGPVGNIAGEERLSAERLGQATGAFEAELMGREVQAKRDEIAQALSLGGAFLSDEMRIDLQMQLAALDAELRREGYGLQREGMSLQNDQFLRELGLREWIAGDNSDRAWMFGG